MSHESGRTDQAAWVGSSVLAILYAAVAAVPLYLIGASAGTFQARIGITTAEFGYAITCYFATGAVVSSLVGPMVDRVPLKRALRIGMAASATSSLVFAFTVETWLLLAAGLALCGAAHSFSQLATNRILAGQVSRRRALGFGLKQASIPVASLFAGLATAALGFPGDPTPLFVGAAVAACALGISAHRLGTPTGASSTSVTRVDRRPLYRLALAAALAAASGNTLSVLIVDAFNDQGFTDQAGSMVLAFGGAVAVFARVTAGLLVDRRRSDGTRELYATLLAGAVCFALLALFWGSSGTSIVAAVLAFGTGWGWPGIVFYVASIQTNIPPATGSGLVLSGTMSGSVLGPLVLATAADHFGYGLAWGLGAGQLAVAGFLMRPRRARSRFVAGFNRQTRRPRMRPGINEERQ